jgi:hypothetical protein
MDRAVDPNKSRNRGIDGPIANSASESPKTLAQVTRREWFKTAAGGCAGLALSGLVDVAAVQAHTQKLKLSDVSEFTCHSPKLWQTAESTAYSNTSNR